MPLFDEDVRIRDREIRELNRERLMKYYCLSNKKSDYEYSGGYFTMINPASISNLSQPGNLRNNHSFSISCIADKLSIYCR